MEGSSALGSRMHRLMDDWRWIPAAVLAMGLIAVGLLVASDSIHESMVRRDLAVVCAIAELQGQAASAHLWTKEYVAGDEGHMVKIDEAFGVANQVADAFLHGGVVHAQAMMPLSEPPLLAQAIYIEGRLEELERLSDERMQLYRSGQQAAANIGSALDMRQDDVFEDLVSSADKLEGQVVTRVKINQERARQLFRLILGAWLAIVVVAVAGLWGRERRRRQAESALRESEAQLLQAQKMEAVGRLAGGIAHDINNYLAAINAQCELVRMKAVSDPRVARKMDSVIATTGKASSLIKRLLAFSRRQPIQPEVVDLNRVVDGLGRMMTRLIGEDVRLETRLGGDLWRSKVDPSQIEQIVVNLLVNAREAMPTGGTVRIETANCEIKPGSRDSLSGVAAGEYVVLSVTDSGIGIPTEIRDKIFEPFFTTKEEAGRSGLGLATVYGIVRQNSGLISVDSEVGKGTTFSVYLPRCLEPETAMAVAALQQQSTQLTGHERILLVEDNEDLRDSTRGVLEAMGYRVQVAANGEEALEICENGDGDIDLLITDVVMPGMSGREVMDRIRERKKDLNVIFISGYTDSIVLRHGVRDGEFAFLQKPFSAESLALKIRLVLQKAHPFPAAS